MKRIQLIACAILMLLAGAGQSTAADKLAVLSADTEGHLNPCETCPEHAGDGGMSRRATLVAAQRSQGPLLLLDAGNFLIGPDSSASDGGVIVAAYNALAYDAVNLSWRDVRLGKDHTLAVLRDAKFDLISANLLDDATGKPLLKPYAVKKLGSQNVAIIGVSEAPAGLAYLPHLREQLAGIRVQPPLEAIAQWLPEAKSKSNAVVLLYYGSPAGLKPIRQKFGTDLLAIFAGGMGAGDVAESTPQVIATSEHGKALALANRTADPRRLDVTQLNVEATLAADPQMTALLDRYVPKEVIAANTRPSPQTGPPTSPASRPMGTASIPPTAPTAPTAPPAAGTPSTMASTAPPVQPPPSKPPGAISTRRVTACSNLAPKGLAGVNLTADQVNAAIDKGADFLWHYIKKKDIETGHLHLGDDAPHVLACLALVHAGAHKKYPDFDKALREYLDNYPPNNYQTIYQYGLAAMLIEAYGDPTYFSKLRMAARYMVEAEGRGGTWTYTANGQVNLSDDLHRPPLRVIAGASGDPGADPGEALSRLTDWKVGGDGDNSCSQFALLGLHSASRCHLKISPDLWKRSLETCIVRQNGDGGWEYHEPSGSSYGSMTCAGICAQTIARFELGMPHPESDAGTERALAWMDDHFSVTENPGRGSYLFYYLYSLERVGRILDTEFIGSHEWYPQGARFLVDRQEKDGSWFEPSDTDPRNPTSFALLFLTRATPTLNTVVKHGGPGMLKADIETPPPARLYVILDASGSMLDIMDGQQKFDLARGAVQGLIDRLPDNSNVALRVYGHRKRSIEEGSDEDTALEIPMEPLNRVAFAGKLKSLRPRGKTPLAFSITQAMSDLSSASAEQPVTVLLLTDGGEDTMPRRDPVKACGELAGKPGITFHIIGFDINQADWGNQLRAMADRARGHYWPADRGGALAQQISAAVFGTPQDYAVLDSTGRQIARGAFGKPLQLPEGKYQFKTSFAGSEFTVAVSISTDSTTGVLFDASRVKSAGASPQGSPTAAQTPAAAPPAAAEPHSVGPPITRRFCTHCGHALPPNAKFCPNCGQPVK